MDFTLQESIEFAKLLPKIYSAFNKYVGENDEEIIIDNSFAHEIIGVIQNLKSKNNDRIYFCKILDDIIDDVNYIKNRNVGEIKSKIF
jgi:hypothetical protein